MSRARNDNPWVGFAFGLCLLAAGTILWLDSIGRLEWRDYFAFWPLGLILVGLAHLPRRQWFAAAVWLILGFFLLAPMAGWGHWSFWRILGMWPLTISVAGITLLSQAFKPQLPSNFHALAVMGGNVRTLGAQDFVSGDVVAFMGGCEVDLAFARPRQGEAFLDVLTFWGGVEVRVPAGWHVENRIVAILGGVEDNTVAPADPNAPRLILRGSVIMGGLEVKNSKGSQA